MTFSPEQIAMLGAKLSSEHIKTRKQGGATLSYIEGWQAESEANRIFGFDGWESHLVYCREVCRYEVTIGKGGQYERQGWKVGYEAEVRVIAGGVVRDGIGHGSASMTDLFDCIESAAKEAATDAEKRALKTFGNPFGLALYDKTQKNVERDGGLTPEQDQRMAESVGKVLNKKPAEDIQGLPRNEQEWKAQVAKFATAINACNSVGAVDKLEEAATWIKHIPSEKTKAYVADVIQGRKDILETPTDNTIIGAS